MCCFVEKNDNNSDYHLSILLKEDSRIINEKVDDDTVSPTSKVLKLLWEVPVEHGYLKPDQNIRYQNSVYIRELLNFVAF